MTSPKTVLPTVYGYERNRHRFGIRNHIAVVPTVFCTNNLAGQIAESFKDSHFGASSENRVVALAHGVGCCSVGFDEDLALRTIHNAAKNPNIGAVLSVSLGCGQFCTSCGSSGVPAPNGPLARNFAGVPLYNQVIVQSGGSERALRQGIEIVQRFVNQLSAQPRVEFPISELLVGVMNGSSDPTSGLFSNLAAGHVCDWIMDRGGRVAFSQTLETLGAERLLMQRVGHPDWNAKTNENLRARTARLLKTVTTMRMAVEDEGESEPTPGNRRGGISTLAEKSIGTVFKIGHDPRHRIVEIVPFGETADRTAGIHLVDGPGQDIICLSGLVAAGAQLIIFTTGGGTPTSSAVSPTLKITANGDTYDRMPGDIDVCLPVETVLDHTIVGVPKSLRDIALETLIPLILEIGSGRGLTVAERRGQSDFQVRQLWPID